MDLKENYGDRYYDYLGVSNTGEVSAFLHRVNSIVNNRETASVPSFRNLENPKNDLECRPAEVSPTDPFRPSKIAPVVYGIKEGDSMVDRLAAKDKIKPCDLFIKSKAVHEPARILKSKSSPSSPKLKTKRSKSITGEYRIVDHTPQYKTKPIVPDRDTKNRDFSFHPKLVAMEANPRYSKVRPKYRLACASKGTVMVSATEIERPELLLETVLNGTGDSPLTIDDPVTPIILGQTHRLLTGAIPHPDDGAELVEDSVRAIREADSNVVELDELEKLHCEEDMEEAEKLNVQVTKTVKDLYKRLNQIFPEHLQTLTPQGRRRRIAAAVSGFQTPTKSRTGFPVEPQTPLSAYDANDRANEDAVNLTPAMQVDRLLSLPNFLDSVFEVADNLIEEPDVDPPFNYVDPKIDPTTVLLTRSTLRQKRDPLEPHKHDLRRTSAAFASFQGRLRNRRSKRRSSGRTDPIEELLPSPLQETPGGRETYRDKLRKRRLLTPDQNKQIIGQLKKHFESNKNKRVAERETIHMEEQDELSRVVENVYLEWAQIAQEEERVMLLSDILSRRMENSGHARREANEMESLDRYSRLWETEHKRQYFEQRMTIAEGYSRSREAVDRQLERSMEQQKAKDQGEFQRILKQREEEDKRYKASVEKEQIQFKRTLGDMTKEIDGLVRQRQIDIARRVGGGIVSDIIENSISNCIEREMKEIIRKRVIERAELETKLTAVEEEKSRITDELATRTRKELDLRKELEAAQRLIREKEEQELVLAAKLLAAEKEAEARQMEASAESELGELFKTRPPSVAQQLSSLGDDSVDVAASDDRDYVDESAEQMEVEVTPVLEALEPQDLPSEDDVTMAT